MKVNSLKIFRTVTGRVILCVALLLCLVATSWAKIYNPRYTASNLTLVSSTALSSRLYELTFSTPAIPWQQKVRVILPMNYASNPTTRYPVLYLLHGCCNPANPTDASVGYQVWTSYPLNAEGDTGPYNMIVVMPDEGKGGFGADWFSAGSKGQPMWETYHIGQLIPWIDANYRTKANYGGRAIAGLSMGGHIAVSYAARYPDLFCMVAAYSGYLDILGNPDYATVASEFDGGVYGSVWGTREAQAVRWHGDHPVDLAENLKGKNIRLYTGNGRDNAGNLVDAVEQQCEQAAIAVHNKLNQLGITHYWNDYGPGTHSPLYWELDFSDTLPVLNTVFGQNIQPPATFPYNSIESAYNVFDWTVQITRNVLEFSRFEVTSTGFKLKGSGSATVTTAAKYVAGGNYRVQIVGPNRNTTITVTAGSNKRLIIPSSALLLGPSNQYQQFTGHTSTFYEDVVTITKI